MELVIEIQDGNPINHPIYVEHLIAAFPTFDPNNLPEKYVAFERVPKPRIKVYEIFEGHEYALIDGVYKDVWNIRQMTDSEKQQQIQEMMNLPHPEDFVFDEVVCGWIPPIPFPNDGKDYVWHPVENYWQEFPIKVA